MGTSVYPEILTNKVWQKKKGVVAKTKGETGVGTAMDVAQAAFKKIDWNKLDATLALPLPSDRRDKEKIETAKKEAIKHYKEAVPPVQEACREIATNATAAAGTWAKNVLLKAARTHALEVAKEAIQFSSHLAMSSSVMVENMKSFDTLSEKIDNKKEMYVGGDFDLEKQIHNLEITISNFLKNGEYTKSAWAIFGKPPLRQVLRSVCNGVASIPEVKKKYWTTWEKFGDLYEKDAPDGPEEEKVIKQKIGTIALSLKELKSNYKSLLV